ncbi:hypothetical protein ACF0H5_011040 [Mactra antiquata]
MSIRSMKSSKSPGEDGIPPGFYKYTYDLLMPLLVCLFNRLFDHGEFPDAWGSAIIFTQRLKDKYLQGWYSKLESSPALQLYKHIDILHLRKFRHCYAQFRSGLQHLEVV